MIELLFNGLMLGVDGLVLACLAKRRGAIGLASGFVIAAVGILALAVLGAALAPSDRFDGGLFAFLGLLAWGVFLHGEILLLGGAWLLRKRRLVARALVLLASVLALAALDGFVIEPHWLATTTYRITSAEITRPIRIVLLADLQTDRVGVYEEFVLREAAALRPDLVLLSGDYIQADEHSYGAELEALKRAIEASELKPPLGVFAVEGNVDRPSWTELFGGLAGRAFTETESLRVGELTITGLSYLDSFDSNLVLQPESSFHLVLGHAPDYARGDVPADLLVAGHTHGGQVRLPFLGPIMTLSSVPRRWADRHTELGGGRHLVVSRGIGMERGHAPRVRFLCRPELVVIELEPVLPD